MKTRPSRSIDNTDATWLLGAVIVIDRDDKTEEEEDDDDDDEDDDDDDEAASCIDVLEKRCLSTDASKKACR